MADIATGRILAWALDTNNTAGGLMNDNSGNNRPGTLTNSPTSINAPINQGLVFNFTNCVTGPTIPSVTDYTVAFYAWVIGGVTIFCADDNAGGTRNECFLVRGTIECHANGTGGAANFTLPDTTNWHFWTIVRSADTISLYIDNSPVISPFSVGTSSSSLPNICIFAANPTGSSPGQFGNGTMCNLTIFDRALNRNDIASLMRRGILNLASAETSSVNFTRGQIFNSSTTSSYTYSLFNSTVSGFIPSGSPLSSPTDSSFSDATVIGGIPYFYKLSINDGSNIAYSNEVCAGARVATTPITGLPAQNGPVVLGYMGDSYWAYDQGSGTIPSLIQADISARFPSASITTINGSVAGQSTGNYLPGMTLNNAIKNAMIAATGYKVLRIQLGSNDAYFGVDLSTWLSNMQAIITDALTWPVDKIIVEQVACRFDNAAFCINNIIAFNNARSQLTGCVIGTAPNFVNQAVNGTILGDNVHPTDQGNKNIAADEATEVSNLFSSAVVTIVVSGYVRDINGTAMQGAAVTYSISMAPTGSGSIFTSQPKYVLADSNGFYSMTILANCTIKYGLLGGSLSTALIGASNEQLPNIISMMECRASS